MKTPLNLTFKPFVLVLSVCIFFGNHLMAQKETPKHSISLDSRFFIDGYSNLAVGEFGLDLLSFGAYPADLLIKPDSSLADGKKGFLFYNSYQARNVGHGFLTLIGSALLSNPFTFAFHEYGHGTRVAALGYEPFYGHGVIRNQADLDAALSGGVKTYDHFLSYYLASLFNTGGYALASDDRTRFPVLIDEIENNGWDGLVAMGGLNNEMLFNEFIEDELNRNGGDIGFLMPYIDTKLSTSQYSVSSASLNDVNNILNFYQHQGFDISLEDLDQGSSRSLFLSSFSYQLVYQFVSMLLGHPANFEAWNFKGIELPNTSFYMTRSGLSHKIKSGYRVGDWRFPVAYEFVYKGDKRQEFSFGVEKKTDKLTTSFDATIGRQLELGVRLDYQVENWLGLSAGYARYDQRNLHGARVIPSLENGPSYNDFYLRATLLY